MRMNFITSFPGSPGKEKPNINKTKWIPIDVHFILMLFVCNPLFFRRNCVDHPLAGKAQFGK